MRLPADRAEERLLLPSVPPPPILPPADAGIGEVLRLVNGVDTSELLFGTDGGMNWSVTTWAVSHPSGAVPAGHLDTEDELGLNGELAAMALVLEALASSHHLCCNATIIYDCKSACDLLLSKAPPDERSGYWCQTRDTLARCAAKGLKVRWVWVPRHGKRPDFRCACFPSELARRLDLGRTLQRLRRWCGSPALLGGRIGVLFVTQRERAPRSSLPTLRRWLSSSALRSNRFFQGGLHTEILNMHLDLPRHVFFYNFEPYPHTQILAQFHRIRFLQLEPCQISPQFVHIRFLRTPPGYNPARCQVRI